MLATSARAQIAYETAGSPDGHDVVLVHAGVTDRRSWRSVVNRLAPRHRCVTFDARGYGETIYEHHDGWSSTDDAIAVMDAAGVERGVVVACSMGGATAVDLTLTHPDRVSALILIGAAINSAPYPEVTEPHAAELERLVTAAEEADDFDEVNRLEAWMWLDGPTAPEGRVEGAARELFLEMNGRALRADDPGERGPRIDAWSRLGEISVPTLVMVGTLDMPDIQAIDEQAAGRITDASLVWLDDTAHLPQLEDHPVFLDEVERFVDAIAR